MTTTSSEDYTIEAMMASIKLSQPTPDAARTEKQSAQAASSKKLNGSSERLHRQAQRADSGSPSKPPLQNTVNVANELTESQLKICNLVLKGHKNVFFTGGAGTGKSHLLVQLIAGLRGIHSEENAVAVTAPTGIAAVKINGCTLHSFAGVGLFNDPVKDICFKVLQSGKARLRWENTKVLIIDEISMVDGEFFDKLEEVAREVRRIKNPFGGIQLVVTGDFFQLPPVAKQKKFKFAFEAKSWSKCLPYVIELKEVFRQKDEILASLLNELRLGAPTPKAIKMFESLTRPLENKDFLPTELFATRDEVAAANKFRLSQLGGPEYTYQAVDSGDKTLKGKLNESCLAPNTLVLKVGAQVMLLKTFLSKESFKLFNGSTGIVTACHDYAVTVNFAVGDPFGSVRSCDISVVDFNVNDASGKQATRSQIPLMLSYAMTFHKSQGQTLQLLKVDLANVFENGQCYVALSRATTLEGMQVLNFNASKVKADRRVLDFYSKIEKI